MSNFSQKGLSLYLAIVIMSILLAIVLGMSTILFYQLKIVGEMGNSVSLFTPLTPELKERYMMKATAFF